MPYRRKKLTFAISSPDEFLYIMAARTAERDRNEEITSLSTHVFVQNMWTHRFPFFSAGFATNPPGCFWSPLTLDYLIRFPTVNHFDPPET